jgi:hypothetical protein
VACDEGNEIQRVQDPIMIRSVVDANTSHEDATRSVITTRETAWQATHDFFVLLQREREREREREGGIENEAETEMTV